MAASLGKSVNAVLSSGCNCSLTRLRNMIYICIFIFITGIQLLTDAQETGEFLKREFSLVKPYQGLGSYSHWDLMGTALMSTDYVRLTPDTQSMQGAVWSRIPCHLRDWELLLHFRVHGHGKRNLNGDGMAVWYTRERMQDGPVFGNMNSFTGLGVFVDTYSNNERQEKIFPYVSAMVGNGSVNYDHSQDGRPTELGGCTAVVRNNQHDTFLSIRYLQRRLTVMVDVDGQSEWRECLNIAGVRLPKGYYFGVSSATGDLSDNHDLISFKLFQISVQEENVEEEEIMLPSVDFFPQPPVEIQSEGLSGAALFFTVLFSVVGCVILAAVAIVLYKRWKENSRKRFY